MERKLRVGVLINTIYSDYSSTFLSGIDKFCKDNNYDQVIFPLLRENTSTYDYIYDSNFSFLSSQNIDILVINSSTLANLRSKQSFLDQLEKITGLPVVCVGLPVNGVPCVVLETQIAINQLVSHVVNKHKRRNILLMHSNGKSEESRLRTEKYLKALLKIGIELPKENMMDGEFEFDKAFQLMEQYIKEHKSLDINAIFCMNDNMALGCISCLEKNKIRVPKDIIVTGYDNIIDTYEDSYNITTIDQHIVEQAYTGASIATEYLKHSKVPMLNTINAVPIFRKSCGCKKIKFFLKDFFTKKENNNEIHHGSGNQITMIHHFFLQNQETVSLNRLYKRLSDSFNVFDISNAYLVFYDKPIKYKYKGIFELPEKAKLVMYFNSKDGIKTPDKEFILKEGFLPKDLDLKFASTQTLMPLFSKDEVYGYMLLSFGQYERIFYQTIYEIFAKEIITSIKIGEVEEKVNTLNLEKHELVTYSEKMKDQSLTDVMTGLYNRRGFYEIAQAQINENSSENISGLVIYGDMDGLKKINDTYGHDAGDKAIILEAQILKWAFDRNDILGRLGGDEFGIISFDKTEADLIEIQEKIDMKCKEIRKKENLPFKLSITLGCVDFSNKMTDLTILLLNADKNLYKNKNFKKSSETF